jgi:hypothetical protein
MYCRRDVILATDSVPPPPMTANNTVHFNTNVTVCLPLVVDLRGNDHLLLLLSLKHLFPIDPITKAVDFVFFLIAEATGRRVYARDVYRL